MQREDVLGEALKLLEIHGIANTTLEMVAERVDYPLDEMQRFWPDKEAILYDALRYLSQQVDIWRRQLLLDDSLSAEQKLLARYSALAECVSNNRYPGCLFIAACTFYPDPSHPIHQLADQQKSAAHDFTHELLTTLEIDDPAMVAKQMELVLEGCLSRMLVNRSHADTGKTTLLKRLIPELCALGLRPGLIKHTHHDMDVDKPGKDSYELRKAGAAQTIVASEQRWALMTETPEKPELDLTWLVSRMDASRLDLVLVEGFKHEAVPKILLFRQNSGHRVEELVIDEHTIAVASDVSIATSLPLLDLNDVPQIATFIVSWLERQ